MTAEHSRLVALHSMPLVWVASATITALVLSAGAVAQPPGESAPPPARDGQPLFEDEPAVKEGAPPARGGDANETPPQPDAAGNTAGIAGPVVSENRAKNSLVHRNFEGVIERLESTPEEAALELLDLNDDERARVLAVLGKRSAAIEGFVARNALLLQEVGSASEAGEPMKALGLIGRAFDEYTLAVGRTPLVDQLGAALPTDKAARLRTLSEEYWNAIIDEGLAGKQGLERALAKPGVVLQESFACMQREIERGFAEAEQSGAFVVETIITRVNASEEQAKQIRAIAAGLYGMGDAEPTQGDIAAALKKVYRVLDEKQREALFDLVVSGEG